MTEGAQYLGSAIGKPGFHECFMLSKVGEWCAESGRLTSFAQTEPQAAYGSLTHGLCGRWAYLLRTMEAAESTLAPVGEMIQQNLLKVISGGDFFSKVELSLLHLPARLGGMVIPCFSNIASEE